MALPSGVTTCTVTFGGDVDFTGNATALAVTATPSQDIIWQSTGARLVAFTAKVTVVSGATGSIALPHVDQTGFVDDTGAPITFWYYTVSITYTSPQGGSETVTKVVQPLVGTTTVDFDLVPSSGPGIPTIIPISGGATNADQLTDAQYVIRGVAYNGVANQPDRSTITANTSTIVLWVSLDGSAPVVSSTKALASDLRVRVGA